MVINTSQIFFLFTQEKTGLEFKLSIATNDLFRRQLKEQLLVVEKKISDSFSRVQAYERLIQGNKKGIAETRGGAEERQRKKGECKVDTSLLVQCEC